MSTDPITLRAARDETIDALCRRFAEDVISMTELERRLDRAREARTRDELRALLVDLPARPATPAVREAVARPAAPADRASRRPARRPEERPAAAEREIRRGSHLAIAVMGGTRRAGKWAPPGNMLAIAMMGGVELDFRDAVFETGVIEINAFSFWGGIEIVVPPDVHVDTHGFALLGGFDQAAELETAPGPDAPTIRVNGFALMGGIDIRVRERGEKGRLGSWKEARLKRGGSTDVGDVGDVSDRW